MKGSTTTVIDPETSQPREFTFDYSYWSHDPKDAHFVDNHKVFADLGSIVLSNAWDGYNVCLFAYGQTGAGKSYSMVGYGNDKGIVPLSLEEMFRRMTSNGNPNVKYQVESSMMEIYNEKVRDLFNPDETPPEGLRVRDHPKLGPYVENLSAVVCTSYRDVEKLMAAGTAARTVASTNMNETSSRAHTIFQITFTTTTFDTLTKKSSNKVSKINLVDLAGSERLSKTGATGAIMKEGININKSLTSLGDCIEKLAKRNKDKNVRARGRGSDSRLLARFAARLRSCHCVSFDLPLSLPRVSPSAAAHPLP
jgi:kinesin family protein 1